MNKTSKIIWGVVVAIIVLLIASELYVVVANKNQQKEVTVNENITASSTSMADWKTYTNEKYGLSFKYPISLGDPVILKDSIAFGTFDSSGNGSATIQISMPRVFINGATGRPRTLTDFINDCYPNKSDICTNLIVGSVKSFEHSSSQIGTIVFVPLSGNQILEIDGDYRDPTFNQILSTFKFTGTTVSTMNWKTYTGINFSIDHPSTWSGGVNKVLADGHSVQFCPPEFSDPDPGVVCKMKNNTPHMSGSYAPIILFTYERGAPPAASQSTYVWKGHEVAYALKLLDENYRDVYTKMITSFKSSLITN